MILLFISYEYYIYIYMLTSITSVEKHQIHSLVFRKEFHRRHTRQKDHWTSRCHHLNIYNNNILKEERKKEDQQEQFHQSMMMDARKKKKKRGNEVTLRQFVVNLHPYYLVERHTIWKTRKCRSSAHQMKTRFFLIEKIDI